MFLCATALLAGTAAAALARPEFRGAQVHSLWSSVSTAEMTRELEALQSAGANVLRVDVGWATLETAKGHYDSGYLAKLDALMNGANARGIKVVATLWQTPSWASEGGAWNDPPSDPADYGAFARFITARYGTELAAVEAWNEPEIDENLRSSNLPATYAQMLKAFYTGAKEGNPAVEVLAGSLAYADLPFLKALYANGIKGFYDAISVHPYADGANPADTSVTHSFLGGIQSLHAAQLEAGDTTPIWVTEFGWPTGNSAGANSEQEQAEYVEEAFGILDGLSYVRGATVYQLRDMGTESSNPEDNFGLLRQDFTPRPAYAAFQAAMRSAPGQIPGTPSSFQGAPEGGSSGTGGSAPGGGPAGGPGTPGTGSGSSSGAGFASDSTTGSTGPAGGDTAGATGTSGSGTGTPTGSSGGTSSGGTSSGGSAGPGATNAGNTFGPDSSVWRPLSHMRHHSSVTARRRAVTRRAVARRAVARRASVRHSAGRRRHPRARTR